MSDPQPAWKKYNLRNPTKIQNLNYIDQVSRQLFEKDFADCNKVQKSTVYQELAKKYNIGFVIQPEKPTAIMPQRKHVSKKKFFSNAPGEGNAHSTSVDFELWKQSNVEKNDQESERSRVINKEKLEIKTHAMHNLSKLPVIQPQS